MQEITQTFDCDSAENFLNVLSPSSGDWGSDPAAWIFRGQAQDWPLIASSLRADCSLSYARDSKPISLTHAQQVIAEFECLRAFLLIADREGIALPEDGHVMRTPEGWKNKVAPAIRAAIRGAPTWPPPELLSMLGLAQHYGVPTRLLDWTEKALVAAYFAVKGALTGSPDQLHRLVVWCINQRYILERWNVDEVEILLVNAPRASNPNLRAQFGLFTVHKPIRLNETNIHVPLDQVLIRAAEHDIQAGHSLQYQFPVLRRITLPHEHAPRLLRMLYSLGIDAATMYPGLAGVVESLAEKRLYDTNWTHPWGSLKDPHGKAYFGFDLPP